MNMCIFCAKIKTNIFAEMSALVESFRLLWELGHFAMTIIT